MSKDNMKYKKLSSLALPLMIMIYPLLALPLMILYFIYGEIGKTLVTDIIAIIMLGLLPVSLTIWGIINYWKVVEITGEEIRSSLFGKFFKKEFKWEEIKEIRAIFIPVGGAWVYISKSSVEGLKISQARKRKDTIQVMYSKGLHKTILNYYENGIVNIDAKFSE